MLNWIDFQNLLRFKLYCFHAKVIEMYMYTLMKVSIHSNQKLYASIKRFMNVPSFEYALIYSNLLPFPVQFS